MTDTFDDAWFDRLLGEVDATAPDDVRARVRQMVAADHQSDVAADLGTPRSWGLLVSSVATAAVIIGGLVVLVGRGDSATIAPTAGTPATQPATTVATPGSTVEQVGAPPVTTPTADSAPDESVGTGSDSKSGLLEALGLNDSATLTGEDATMALRAIHDYRVEVLRNSPGFSATSTLHRTGVLADGSKPTTDPPPTVVDATVLANGDVWAEFADGDWFSADGPAGIFRRFSTNTTDGAPVALEASTFPGDHSYGYVLGHDPLQLLPDLDSGFPFTTRLEVAATEFEAGDAVSVLAESKQLGSQRFVIDLDSALVVEFESTQPDEKGTIGQFSALSDVREAEVLPVASPPPLPEGLDWFRFPDPSAPVAATIDEARAAFGSGLVLPRAALDGGTVALEHRAKTVDWTIVDLDDPRAASRYVIVNYVEPVGLLRTRVYVHTERLVPGGPVPADYVQIDDRICMQPCDSTAPGAVGIEPDAGALAGVPFFDTFTNVDGTFLSIEAPTDADALAIANTFEVVEGS